MSEEQQIEKTHEKYFYVDKKKTYKVLTSIATSFIGAGLALALFGWSRPPMPPCPCSQHRVQIECPCARMHQHPQRPKCDKQKHRGERRDMAGYQRRGLDEHFGKGEAKTPHPDKIKNNVRKDKQAPRPIKESKSK